VLNISIEDFAAHMGETPADIRAYEAGVYLTRQTASVLTRCLDPLSREDPGQGSTEAGADMTPARPTA
jgi:ribosome-binding protein aMBF1 (putative translation factor)